MNSSTLTVTPDPKAIAEDVAPEAPPSIWYKAQRVIRTVLAVVVAIVTGLASTLGLIALVAPQVLTELQPLLSPEIFGWLVGVVAAIVTLSGVITRIMAIPAINALLTKFGAGSVPQSALEPSTSAKRGR